MSHFLRPLLAPHPVAPVLINERTGAVVANTLEAAFDSGARRRGLLGRDDLAAGAALVLAPCNAVHTCRMRFPIDVVFVTRDGRITKIVRRLAAWRAAASFQAFATIELRGGALEGTDLTVGDHLVVVCEARNLHSGREHRLAPGRRGGVKKSLPGTNT